MTGGERMRCALTLSVVLVLLTTGAGSQVVRLPSGGCSVSRSGMYACSRLGRPPIPGDTGPALFRLTQYVLAPDAPLTVEHPDDAIIVALDEGTLVDEANPESHINVFKGSSLLVTKGKKT